MEDAHIHKALFEFIEGRHPDIRFGPADDIFALGFVNSLFAMELVLFLESTFEFTVPVDALRLENFRTVEAMAALVNKYAAA
ncbi:acyl carrier protein [Micromonospora sp. NPDC049044]|uniref:acyl carrier protein n=1 Tax=unclassified Micromonospora TaxID=2617518 RepID=UPI0033C83BFB